MVEAIERLATYFGGEQTRQGVLARAALGRPGADDAELARRLLGSLGAEVRSDGSIGGAVVPTIWRVHELMDLSQGGRQPEVVARLMEWILALQGKPGAFGEGCDKVRHAQRVCEHYVGGFFAPAPPGQRLAPVTLPNGKVFRNEPAARFVISCLALRAALRTGFATRTAVNRHVVSLVHLADQWTGWNIYFAPDVVVSGLHTLAVAGGSWAHGGAVARVVSLVAANQREDGEWPGADLFLVLEALLAAGTDDARNAVRRAAPALAARQRADGTFGP
ncbi:MAG: hypothetical protein ACREMX_15035, partial [Gemmatimonadales bacterium]